MLGENQLIVQVNIEDAAGFSNKFRFVKPCFLQFFRQTGGARKVVSHSAVSDPNHEGLLDE